MTITALSVNAQVQLSQWDVAPIGKKLGQANDTIHAKQVGSLNPGPSGANQTWNFSNLQANTTDTLTFTNPSWLGSASSFPTSNLAVVYQLLGNGAETYLQLTPAGLFIEGAYGDPLGIGAQTINFKPHEQLMKFPDAYGNSFTNKSRLEFTIPFSYLQGVDSLHVIHNVSKDIKTDAWGKITTPLKTFDCLRHSGFVTTIDTVLMHAFGTWLDVTPQLGGGAVVVKHFEWWAPGAGFPVLAFDSAINDTIKNITWLKTLPVVGAVNEIAPLSELKTYPNPASANVNFEIKSREVSSIDIFDLSGKMISSIPVNNTVRTVTYNTSNIASGTYFYRTKDSKGNAINRRKFGVAK